MKIININGPINAGKTTVSKLLADLIIDNGTQSPLETAQEILDFLQK